MMRFLFPSMFVFPYAILLALAVVISPILAVLLLIPPVLFIFWVSPSARNFPKNLLMAMFFLWLFLNVLWPSYLRLHLPGFPGIEPSRIILSVLIMVWFFYLIKNPNIKKNIHFIYKTNLVLVLFLVLVVLTRLFSVFFSELFFQSFISFTKDMIEVFLPALIFISIISTKKDIERFIFNLALIGLGIILIAIVEIIISKNIFSLYLPSGVVMSSEFIEKAISERVRGGSYRVQSSFSHPLLLAQFLVVLLPVYIYLFLTHSRKIVSLVSLVLIPVTILVLYKTGSRSIFVALVAELVVLAILYLRLVLVTKKASPLGWLAIFSYPVFILLGVFIFYLTLDYFLGQTVSEIDSTNARLQMWEKGLYLIMDSPITGFGSGTGAHILNFSSAGSIDSYYLSVLLENGYLGFFVFIMYFIFVFRLGFELIKLNSSDSAILFTIIVAISGYLTIALILSTPDNLYMLFIFSMLLAVYKARLVMVAHPISEKTFSVLKK